MKSRLLSLAAAVFLMSGTAHAANLILDGDFINSPTSLGYTTYASSSSFGPWNVTTATVDLINTYLQSPTPAITNSGSVDLDGTPGAGAIAQIFSAPAGNYVLTFDLSGNPGGPPTVKELQVSVGGVTHDYSYTIGSNTTSNMMYVPETLDFTSPGGNLTLAFTSLDPGGPNAFNGPVVGDVSVSSTPLPATLLLFGSGLLGLLLVARRRLVKA